MIQPSSLVELALLRLVMKILAGVLERLVHGNVSYISTSDAALKHCSDMVRGVSTPLRNSDGVV